MAKKNYDWKEGAKLDEHSKRKHKILREYFREYLITRCKIPQQEKFRLAVVDGFCGAGKYECGNSGSPLIVLECLKEASEEINITRSANGMKPVEIECFLAFNDLNEAAIKQLQKNAAPLLAEIKDQRPLLHLEVDYTTEAFDHAYLKIKAKIQSGAYKSVIFNLDQCGSSHVNPVIIKDILFTWRSAEAFLTFPIEAALAFISPDKEKSRALKHNQELHDEIYKALEEKGFLINKNSWLGEVERIVFESLKECAAFVSPFSIHNPDGWRYWLIHFANNYRARQVYNNILHKNSTMQAHFGRSGLQMLSYDPSQEGVLYLFDIDSRKTAKEQLHDDIPRLITQHGDVLSVEEFYMTAYNETPAHSDDIHEMMMANPDVEVITPSGNPRRKANTIKTDDILRMKNQRSLFPMFFDKKKQF